MDYKSLVRLQDELYETLEIYCLRHYDDHSCIKRAIEDFKKTFLTCEESPASPSEILQSSSKDVVPYTKPQPDSRFNKFHAMQRAKRHGSNSLDLTALQHDIAKSENQWQALPESVKAKFDDSLH